MTAPRDVELRRYLLGQLSQPEAEAIEAAYFADQGLVARLDDVDDDLARAYLAEALSPADRAAFAARLGEPARAARLELVRRLTDVPSRAAGSPPTAASSRWTTGLAAAAVLVLAVGGWWLATRQGPSNDVPPQAATPPTPAPPTPAPVATPPLPVTVALVLPITATRSGGATPTAELPADADRVVLRLTAPLPPLSDLSAEVRAVDAAQEWRGAVTPAGPDAPEATTGEVIVPAASLAGGDYVLSVRRDEAMIARAFFRVVRR